MWLLAELFEELPEVGDRDKPKLVFFFDEAHLLFDGATKAFLESVVQTVRLIRSKGVGVFFCTQKPKDMPADVLAQLGNRIQHALRAFTPDDAKALRATVATFPKSDFYDLERAAHAARDRRGGGDDPERERRADAGRAHADPRAALADGAGRRRRRAPRRPRRSTRSTARASTPERAGDARGAARAASRRRDTPPTPRSTRRAPAKAAGGGADAVGDFLKSSTGRQIQREVVRGLFGLLKKGRL